MATNHTWSESEYENRGKEEQAFRELAYRVSQMHMQFERFADSPTKPEGVMALAQGIEELEWCMAVLRAVEWATHREMKRLTQGTGLFRAIRTRFKEGDTEMGFGYGRKVEQHLAYLNRMANEWAQVARYATSEQKT